MAEIFWIEDLNLHSNLIDSVKDLVCLNSLDDLKTLILFGNGVIEEINEGSPEVSNHLNDLTDKLRNFVEKEAQNYDNWTPPLDNFSTISSAESNASLAI